jgi:D-aspartate ligase
MTSDLSGIDASTPAVVLKLDANPMHHGGLGAIRSLGRLGVPVYGVHESAWAPAANSRYLHGRWFWRPDPEDTERLRLGLERLAGRIGRPAVLIPTDDAGAIFLAEHGDGLRNLFLFPAPPADLPRRLAGKYSLYQLCRELDVPCPRAAVPGSLDEAREFGAATGFPLIAKLTAPWRRREDGGKALRSTTIVGSRAELDAIHHACGRDGLMLQEFIPAERGGDWFFHGYCDAKSVCRPAFTGVKDRSYPPHAGLTSLGRSAPNPRLRGEIARLLTRLSYRGIMDLDLRRDPRDGRYKLLDFNPRLGAQFRLFRATAGLDVVLAEYLDMTGQSSPGRDDAAGEQVSGRRFLVENYDPISSVRYWRDGELGLRSWAASLRGIDETAWFAGDDLRPFGLMCLYMGARAAHAACHPFTRRGHGKARADAPSTQRVAYSEPSYRPGRAAGRRGGVAGTANPRPPSPGPAMPGPATPGPATPGPATPGPATPGPATPGPATRSAAAAPDQSQPPKEEQWV